MAKKHENEALLNRKLDKYNYQRDILIEYLRMKTDICDWHAVADAAMDLRELEASK